MPTLISANMASSTSARHVIPGEYEYDGDIYGALFPRELVARIRDFDFRNEDVVLVSYPKTGTQWMQEILYLVHNDGLLRSDEVQLGPHERVPFLEMRRPPPERTPYMDVLDSQEGQRIMKSHQRVEFFENPLKNKRTKFIVLLRNARDTLVSYCHFYRSNALLGKFEGTFEEFFLMFKQKKLAQGDWFNFVQGWHNQKHNKNCCFFHYETMKKDLFPEVKRLANFLGKTIDDDVIQGICEQVSFDAMKKNEHLNASNIPNIIDPKISPLIRKGQVGDWKNYFTPSLEEQFNDMYNKEMNGLDIVFEYE